MAPVDTSMEEVEPTPLLKTCEDILVESQGRSGNANENLVEANIAFLSTKTVDELRPTTTEEVALLTETMRDNFIQHREVDGEGPFPVPISGGAGFATVAPVAAAGAGERTHEHLLGVYQGNTSTGVCNHPFAPSGTRDEDARDSIQGVVLTYSREPAYHAFAMTSVAT